MKLLITGANGLIGNLLFHHLHAQPERFSVLGLDRSAEPSERIWARDYRSIPAGKFILAELGDSEALNRACAGMDCVVHLAADPDGRSWESVRDNNLVGAYHLFEAARGAGVRWVVFASTIMVNFGYPAEELYGAILRTLPFEPPERMPLIQHTDPTRPPNIYAASKVWGEALAYIYSYQHGMSCPCVRVGWVRGDNLPPTGHSGADWCSHRDAMQMFERCISAPPELRFDIFYAVSDNKNRIVDLEHARQVLGYAPQDP
jgi:nucleoside-diphosphate-sugar epimerase